MPQLRKLKAYATGFFHNLGANDDDPFAARLRDVVVSADNRTALVTAAGWDRNAFFVDLDSGAVRRSEKIGHHFAYAPLQTATGFAVQGYDLNSGSGTVCRKSGTLARRKTAKSGRPTSNFGKLYHYQFEGVVDVEVAGKAPTDWETNEVDLWQLHGKPFSIRSLSLGAVGDGALFDRILLVRKISDLDR